MDNNYHIKTKVYRNTSAIYLCFGIAGLYFPCSNCSIYNLIIPTAFILAGIYNTFKYTQTIKQMNKNKINYPKELNRTKIFLIILSVVAIIMASIQYYAKKENSFTCNGNCSLIK